MARTPLLDTFAKLFREYRGARDAGLPLAGLREQRAARVATGGISRREVIAGGAAAAIALGFPRRLSASGDPAVAIVGGGVKYFPWDRIGARASFRYTPTMMNDEESEDFCDPFGFCQGSLQQIEFAVGAVVRF